jgi:hypothetical protein
MLTTLQIRALHFIVMTYYGDPSHPRQWFGVDYNDKVDILELMQELTSMMLNPEPSARPRAISHGIPLGGEDGVLKKTPTGHWYIENADHQQLAWSGSEWIPVPQVASWENQEDAEREAAQRGIRLLGKDENDD